MQRITERHRWNAERYDEISLVFAPNPDGLREIRCWKWSTPGDPNHAITMAEVRDALGSESGGRYVQLTPRR